MKGFAVLVLGLALTGCATMQPGSPQATADLKNTKGEAVGTASFWEDAGGVRVRAQLRGLSPGKHGFHIHAVGKCDPPDFMSSGGHFNPGGKKHGFKSQAGAHAGDLPNLEAGADGTASFDYVAQTVTLRAGPTSLFDADGSALVIHANPDDEVTDPTGNSGGRVACGVVRKATASAGYSGSASY